MPKPLPPLPSLVVKTGQNFAQVFRRYTLTVITDANTYLSVTHACLDAYQASFVGVKGVNKRVI